MRNSGLELKGVINKADAAFERAYAEGDYEEGAKFFEQHYDDKLIYTPLGSNKDGKAGCWRPPYSEELAIKQAKDQSFHGKNNFNTVAFWFSERKTGRIQHFRSEKDVKIIFWKNFFCSLLDAADRHNPRQEQKTT